MFGKLIAIVDLFLSALYCKILKQLVNVNPKMIVFQGKPDYSDNPRALSDYMVANGFADKYQIFWLVSETFVPSKQLNKVTFVKLKNKIGLPVWSTYKVLLSAKYVFSSHGFMLPKSNGLVGQKYITLWHGCGYKDNAGTQLERFFDLALVPGPIFVKTKSHFWNTSKEFLLAKGYPRYDWMLNPSEKAILLLKSLKKKNEKIIIWMPTYRNSTAYRGYAEDVITNFPLMSSEEDWINLDAVCKKNGVCLLIKLHMSQRNYDIDFCKFTNIIKISNHDFEVANVQMYEFLSFTDALISDYSSVAIDYLVVNKPIAFALDDFGIYKRTRGFVFEEPRDYMPGHHLYTCKDLHTFISDVACGNDIYAERRKKIAEIAIYPSNNYCKEIVECLIS